MKLDSKKKYIIVQNLEDHEGYNGEKVIIVHSHSEQFYTACTDSGQKYFCGIEELQEVEM